VIRSMKRLIRRNALADGTASGKPGSIGKTNRHVGGVGCAGRRLKFEKRNKGVCLHEGEPRGSPPRDREAVLLHRAGAELPK
jgi:hypothetical protein